MSWKIVRTFPCQRLTTAQRKVAVSLNQSSKRCQDMVQMTFFLIRGSYFCVTQRLGHQCWERASRSMLYASPKATKSWLRQTTRSAGLPLHYENRRRRRGNRVYGDGVTPSKSALTNASRAGSHQQAAVTRKVVMSRTRLCKWCDGEKDPASCRALRCQKHCRRSVESAFLHWHTCSAELAMRLLPWLR